MPTRHIPGVGPAPATNGTAPSQRPATFSMHAIARSAPPLPPYR